MSTECILLEVDLKSLHTFSIQKDNNIQQTLLLHDVVEECSINFIAVEGNASATFY